MSRDSQKRYREKNVERIRQIEKKSNIKNCKHRLKSYKQRYEHICDSIENRFESYPLFNRESLLSNIKFVRKICKK